MEDESNTEIVFENDIESQQTELEESEEKAFNDIAEEETEKNNDNSEGLHAEDSTSNINKADSPSCETSEHIVCEEESEALSYVDNIAESGEIFLEQKSDLAEQNIATEDSAKLKELTQSEDMEANDPDDSVCAQENTSVDDELHSNVDENLKPTIDYDKALEAIDECEKAVEDNSHSASLSSDKLGGNLEEELEETESSQQDVCIKDYIDDDSGNTYSDNLEFKNEPEESLERNEMGEECGNQSACDERMKNQEALSEGAVYEVADASKENLEIFQTNKSVDENEKIQSERMHNLEGVDLEDTNTVHEEKEVSEVSDTDEKSEDEGIKMKCDSIENSEPFESELKNTSTVKDKCQDNNLDIECTDASQSLPESSNILLNTDGHLNTASDDHKISIEVSELQSEAKINTNDNECQDDNQAFECTDASEYTSQIVPESSNVFASTDSNTSDDQKKGVEVSELQTETNINTSEFQADKLAFECTDSSESKPQTVPESSNFFPNTDSNLNAATDDEKKSGEVSEMQSETIISANDCQDDNQAIECTDASEFTCEIIPESSNSFANNILDDHKERAEAFELQSETISEFKEFESGDFVTSDILQPFESESILSTDFESSDANSTELLSNRHISGKINAIVSEISTSGNSVLLAVTPSDLLDEFSQLSNSLQSTYSSKSTPFEKNASQLCAVLADDNLWYRAKILHLSNDNIIALLIDNGSCKEIDIAKVRNLDSEHENIPPFSIWCTLASVSILNDKTKEVKEYLKAFSKDKLVEVNVIEEEEPCKISMSVGGINVLNELLKENLVIQTLPLNSAENDQSAVMSYCHINDDDIKMFVNLTAQLEDLENLKKFMQDSYNKEAFEVPVSESSVYAVFYKDLWLRAQMLSCDAKPCAKLIDFGECLYDVQNFYALLPEHCLYPPFAIPCQVSLTHKLDADSSNALKDILGSSKFTVKLEESPETETVSAVIVDKDLINKVKELGVCFKYSTSAQAEIFAGGDSVKSDCLELTCEELDNVKLDTLNEMDTSVSTKEYVSLLNESFSTDSSMD